MPVFAADVKGDLSGMSVPGEAGKAAEKRQTELGIPFAPKGFPTEYLALGGIGAGVPVRATVSDFGPQLLAKILGANQTQEQSLGLVFHYADEKGLPLVDLADLRALLTFLDSDEGKAELKGIGGLSGATVGVLLRSLVGLEEGGGNEFFGEPQFAIADLLRTAEDGRGVISCLELPGVQDKPKLFSTALMWLLAELFEDLPEAGDLDKPKLVFFFDEAHLLFDDATDAFLDSVAQTVRLIRSKGVGIFFVTQNPQDLPAEVLGQLGSRIQHALRAFTPDDAKALKATVSTYPKSDFYDLGELLTADGDRRGGGDRAVGPRHPDAGRAHAAGGAGGEHGPGARRRRRRRRRRRCSRATASGSTTAARARSSAGGSRRRSRCRRPSCAHGHVPVPKHGQAERRRPRRRRPSGDFLARARASSSSARSSAAWGMLLQAAVRVPSRRRTRRCVQMRLRDAASARSAAAPTRS